MAHIYRCRGAAGFGSALVYIPRYLEEIKETYGFEANAIVSMADVIEHLYNKEYNGKVLIDDELKAAIDAYYAEYGA